MKRSRSGHHLSRAKRLQKPEEDRAESALDILILGPVPPPFGGVSMHLTRLVPRLERAGFMVGVLNHFRSTDRSFVVGALNRNPLKYYFLPKKFRKRILHYHDSRWPQLVATALGKGSSNARYIVTLHSGDIDKQFLQLTTRKPLVARITRWALRRFDTVIAVNPSIASVIEDHLQDRKVEVLPAFLESGDEEAESYESSIEAFLESGRVLVVSAYASSSCRDRASCTASTRHARRLSSLRPNSRTCD